MKLCLVLLLGMAAVTSAAAFDRNRAVAECTGDAMRLCFADLGSGEAAIVACMKRHRAELSPGCSSAVAPAKKGK